MSRDALATICEWFDSHCDGDWEHSTRISISNLDNPGWSVDVNLGGTSLAGVAFGEREIHQSDADWLRCWVEDEHFYGVCGPKNLTKVLDVLASWLASDPSAQS